MSKTKVCSSCGYVTTENDIRCPICGGHMESYYGSGDTHNKELEDEFNGGYHNDFAEGRKTGDYCDRELEKNVNGGQHIHNISTYVHQNEPDNLAERSHPKTSSYGDFNINGKPIYELDKKEILKLQAIFSLFPVVGLVFLIVFIKQFEKYQMDESYKRDVILVYIGIKLGETLLTFIGE